MDKKTFIANCLSHSVASALRKFYKEVTLAGLSESGLFCNNCKLIYQ